MNEYVKNAADAASVATILATLAAVLPPLAALASLIWGCIRIYETRTVQKWVRRRKAPAEDFTCMYASNCARRDAVEKDKAP